MYPASQVESQVPKLSPVLAALTLLSLNGRIWESVSFHSFGQCIRTDKKLGYFLSGGGDGKLVKPVPFLLENDLTAAKRIMD